MRLLITALILFVSLLAFAVLLAVQDEPAVRGYTALSPEDIARARALLAAHDPRDLKEGERRSVTLSDSDLTLLANHAVRHVGSVSARAASSSGKLSLQATLSLPASPVGRYVNVDLRLEPSASRLKVARARIGALPVPGWLADIGLKYGLQQLNAQRLLKHVRFGEGQVNLVYEWHGELLEQMRNYLLPAAQQARLLKYQHYLYDLSKALPRQRHISLAQLLEGLFLRARNTSPRDDPAAANRAVIIVLAAYVNGHSLKRLVPGDAPRPIRHRVVLQNRVDLAQHFMVSAALAVAGGDALADAVGVYKEMADARRGSGFSFTDLAADRAGTRFGSLAVMSPQTARMVQAVFAAGINEADFMPSVAGLPEFMSAADFARRYGRVGSPAYRELGQRIEARINACALYH